MNSTLTKTEHAVQQAMERRKEREEASFDAKRAEEEASFRIKASLQKQGIKRNVAKVLAIGKQWRPQGSTLRPFE